MRAPDQPRDFLRNYSLGLKLRTLRAAKGLTLTRLANEVGLSTALLSKLERDHMVPTLPTLARICCVYGVGLGYFFSEPEQHSVAVTRNPHMLAKRARGQEPVTITYLHMPAASGRLLGRIFDIPPGAPSNIGACDGRTELLAYVLQGKLQLTAAGSTEVLETGDCIFLDTNEPAQWCAIGEPGCRILTVAATPGHPPQ
jgi:transcriptional regulator with XRE-family HTH domain